MSKMDLIEKMESSSEVFKIEIINKAKDWAMLHGLCMRTTDGSTDRVEFMSFTLLPSIFPRMEYIRIRSLQYVVNEVYRRMAYDSEFLSEALREVLKTDGFVRRLFDIYEGADSKQTVSLGLLRSDYMLDQDKNVCKQVKVNTVAAGHGWIGTNCVKFHRYVLEELKFEYCDDSLPVNKPIDGLCNAFVDAWYIYNNPRSVTLFIVEDYEENIADQRYHEYRLRELEPRIHVLCRSLGHVFKFGKLVGDDRYLIVDGYEVALVYFRSGYAPEQYPTEDQWNARLMIEQSNAIKCPSMGYFLAGTEKIQQVLAQPGSLERFVSDEDCHLLRQVFADFYPLDFNEAGDAATEMAIARPSSFVLIPQREGGSNNLFGDDVKRKLEAIRQDEERSSWTLMDRISAKVCRNYLVRPNNCEADRLVDVISEIGIFGAIIGNSKSTISSKVVGHTLRTKLADVDEGRVSSGFGACDSPYLV